MSIKVSILYEGSTYSSSDQFVFDLSNGNAQPSGLLITRLM